MSISNISKILLQFFFVGFYFSEKTSYLFRCIKTEACDDCRRRSREYLIFEEISRDSSSLLWSQDQSDNRPGWSSWLQLLELQQLGWEVWSTKWLYCGGDLCLHWSSWKGKIIMDLRFWIFPSFLNSSQLKNLLLKHLKCPIELEQKGNFNLP